MEEENTEKVEEVSKTPLLDDAQKLATSLKEQNDRTEELLKKQEELQIKQSLGGHASAGQPQEEVKEETPAEYRDKVMSGELNGKQ